MSGSSDGTIKIWDLDKKDIKSTFSPNIYIKISEICLFSCDKILAVAGSGGVVFWTLSNKEREVITKMKTTAIAFSNDECFFIIGNEIGSIQIWDSANYSMIYQNSKHNREIYKIVFSQDSQYFATCSDDQKVIIWDFQSRIILHSLDYGSSVRSVLFLEDSQSLAVCTDLPEIYFFKFKAGLNDKILNLKI